jgi:hypothetical protein
MLGCRSTRAVTLTGPAVTNDHLPAGPEAWRPLGRRGGSSAGFTGCGSRRNVLLCPQHPTKFSDFDLLAKVFSAPIYYEAGYRQTHSAILPGRLQPGDVMTSIDDVNLDTYCGRVGNLYGRHGLCPPFALRRIAADWMTNGIALPHIVAVIDRHLTDHRRRYYSGSGDALFGWVDEVVRKTWYERQVSPRRAQSSWRTIQRIADREWIDREPSTDSEVDLGRSPIALEAPTGNWSAPPGYGRGDQAPPESVKSIGQKRRQPKQIDRALAFLRRELASGAVAAVRLEEKAKASGISARTLDRARARLKVISRRTGFAKDGKCWCSLPMAPSGGA